MIEDNQLELTNAPFGEDKYALHSRNKQSQSVLHRHTYRSVRLNGGSVWTGRR